MSDNFDLFGEMWLHESGHSRNVWEAMQRRHLDAQTSALMEEADRVMNRGHGSLADLHQRIEALNSRVRYIAQYAEAVYRARQVSVLRG
jgi:hypothetical protein